MCTLAVALVGLSGMLDTTRASDTPSQCPTAKTTAATAKCASCNAFKGLLSLVKDGQARLETHEVEHGVMVQVSAERKDAVHAIHEAMQQLRAVEHASPAEQSEVHLCDLCATRMVQLSKAMQEWAMTSTGATLVLTSTDPELVQWLREDGRSQQQLVDRVAER